MGYGPVATAVVGRSLRSLENLLRCGHDPDEEGFGYPGTQWWQHPPLCLALGWPSGFETLLKAGANPSVAVEVAMDHADEAAFKLLIEYDCPMSFKAGIDNMVLDQLKRCRLGEPMIDLALSKAVDQRQRLWALLQQSLSGLEIDELDIRPKEGELLDAGCVIAQEALLDRGIEVPLGLRVSNQKPLTIYHSRNWMSSNFAQKLFDAGFRDVDNHVRPRGRRSSYSPTPFIRCCRQGNFNSALWFMKMGARTRIDEEDFSWIAQHLVASSVTENLDAVEVIKVSDLLQRLKRSNGPFESDRCVCYCSLKGCTPITTLHRCQSDDIRWYKTWSEKISSLQCWLEWGQFSLVEARLAWKAFSRLEIFTRLGMAHTCCRHNYSFQDIRILAPDEQAELRDEDTEAGLVQDLESYMQKYEEQEKQFQGTLEEFLALWWSDVNCTLNFNETRKGRCEKEDPIYSEEYFDCDVEIFLRGFR